MKAENVNVKPLMQPSTDFIQRAVVVSVSNESIIIDVSGITQEARLVYSCLVKPARDDIVMCCMDGSGYYILGIVDRPGTCQMTIDLPGDASMQTRNGSLSFRSDASVNLLAANNINCMSDKVIQKSRESVFDCNDVAIKGQSLQLCFNKIQVLSELISSMARHVIDKFNSYIRHTEEFDQIKAGQMTREVSGLYSMDSRYTVMVSRKDTKIDGERIHMG